MTENIKKNNQLVKAKTSSLQKIPSNIVSRGLSDLALLDVEKAEITDEEKLLQAREWFKKGYNYYINKEYDKAIEAYTNAVALNPNYANAYYNRELAYGRKGQYDMAIEDFNKAIALDPNNAKIYYNRGLVYVLKGNIEKAISDFQKACDMGHKLGCKNLQRVLREMDIKKE